MLRLVRFALLPAAVIVLAACSAQGGSTAAPNTPSAGASAPAAPTSSPIAAIRIEVQLVDALRIEPASMTVPAGVPVTFVVTNAGAIEHEFYLGDEQAQLDHAAQMVAMGGMTHDEPEGIGVDPGETKELIYTFAEPGETLAGCHVEGHYLGGMMATITINP